MFRIFSVFPWSKPLTKNSGKSTDISGNENIVYKNQLDKEKGEIEELQPIRNNVTLFLEPETILQRSQCVYLVEQIKEIAGLSDDKFDLYYRPAILSFTRLCQSVGASQRNHHSEPYGLIEHSLEVAMYAMRKSQGSVYFPDREVETIQWLERVFMYCCFIGGLLHDGGKIFTNFRWYTRKGDSKWTLFNPMIHKIPNEADQIEYRIKPYQNKKGINVHHQSSHELFAANLFQDVIPQAGLEWIISYSEQHCAELFIDLVHTISSDYSLGHELGECVKYADQVSTDDGIKRYHEFNNNRDFVDMSDPNLPLFESFKSVLKDIIANPGSFNLVTNKVAMGKYSQMERYGDLIFLSAKSVLPIVKKRLSDKGISLPNDQAIFTTLVDNNVTLPAPSGDTFWWVEFYSENNANKSKEMSYFVMDSTKLKSVGIDDLRCFDVKYTIGDKSLCLDADEEEVMPYSEENYPDLYSLLHDSEFELVNKKKKVEEQIDDEPQPQDTSENLSDEETDSETVNETEDEAETEEEPVMSFGASAENQSNDVSGTNASQTPINGGGIDAKPTPKASSTPLVKTTPVSPPPSSDGVITTTPAAPPSTAPVQSQTPKQQNNSTKGKPAANKREKTSSTQSNKRGRGNNKKKAQQEGSMLDKVMGVGLGLNPSSVKKQKSSAAVASPKAESKPKVNPDPKAESKPKVNSKPKSVSNQTKVSNQENESNPVDSMPPAIETPPIEAYDNYDSGNMEFADIMDQNDGFSDYMGVESTSTNEPTVTISDNEIGVSENERPFAMDSRINKPPREVPLSERMERLLGRNHGLGCDPDTSIYNSDKDQVQLTKLLKGWIPYIEKGMESGLIRKNEPNAHVLHLKQGVFFAEAVFRETFDDILTDELFEALSKSAATLLHNDKPGFSVEHEDGTIQRGVVITVRAFKPNDNNLPLYRNASFRKGV